jgi:lipopolysaccharide export system permease protein
MNRIDLLVLNRLASRIGVTVFVFYGLIALVESLDTWRFNYVAESRGVFWAVVMVAMSAVKWTIKTLPVTVLLGAILGFVDLKSRHELTVIHASGISIWKAVRAPTLMLIMASLIIALGAETISTQINRQLDPRPPSQSAMLVPAGEIWLEERGDSGRYIIMATGVQPGGTGLINVIVFGLSSEVDERIEAGEAFLERGQWRFANAVVRSHDAPPRRVSNYTLPSNYTAAELSARTSSTEDMGFFELATLLGQGVADPAIRNAATMRFFKLLALPMVLTGSLFIAFAFTAGYRRGSNYGPAVLYGVVLGFVVFVITEMADRGGSTGVLDPTFAALGPAFVAIVIGVTILLHKEDGRA